MPRRPSIVFPPSGGSGSGFQAKFHKNPRIKALWDLAKLTPKDMDKISLSLDRVFRKNMRAQFRTSGRSGGDKWKELSEKYRRWKSRNYGGRPLMVLRNKLRKSLTDQGGQHIRRYRISRAGFRAAVHLGTSDPKAVWHGPKTSPLANPRLPVRDVLQHTDKQEQEYARIVVDFVANEKLERVFRVMRQWKKPRSRGPTISPRRGGIIPPRRGL